MQERIEKLLLELVDEINNKILDNEFKVIERGESTITIRLADDIVKIWTHVGGCEAYMIGDIYFPINTLRSPEECRKLLFQRTEDEKQIEVDRINKEIKKLELLKGKLWNI